MTTTQALVACKAVFPALKWKRDRSTRCGAIGIGHGIRVEVWLTLDDGWRANAGLTADPERLGPWTGKSLRPTLRRAKAAMLRESTRLRLAAGGGG